MASVVASQGAYASEELRVECPRLERERIAEIESRARASLLLTALAERVTVTCDGDIVIVEATGSGAVAQVRAPTHPATVVDDVLAGVDQAFEQLRQSQPRPASPAPAPASKSPSPPTAPRTPPQVALNSEATSPRVAHAAAPPVRSSTLVAVAAGLEAWSGRAAGGLVVAARRGRAPFWLGISGGAFRPVSQDAQFDVTELSLSATVTLQPAIARGLCLTLQAGPSWLWIAPDAQLAVRSHTLSATFAAGSELSWPIWRGRTGVTPALGVRWFGTERGVRLDLRERFALAGAAPHVLLTVVRRLD